MNPRLCSSLAAIVAFTTVSTVLGQALPTSATIESEPITLTPPERFQVVSTLEPIRRVSIIAPVDGLLRSLDVAVGSTVRDSQQIAELDRTAAAAGLKIAEAEVAEKTAAQGAMQGVMQGPAAEIAKAQITAAQARVELARLELDRLTLRAPFAGRITSVPVSSGQYVLKGTVIAELADVTILKALAPVDRRTTKPGGETNVSIEDREQSAKVHSLVPLAAAPEFRPLLDLAAPLAAAWIQVPNTKGDLEPGLRVRASILPASPVAVVPRASIKPPAGGVPDSVVQVIRAEHVVDVRIKTLGPLGPERVQVSGPFRSNDALIVSSSVPLIPGTFIRFGVAGRLEGAPPNPNQPGLPASVAPNPVTPRSGRPPAGTPSPAPAPTAPGSTPF